ncbi:hypothetical protein [Nonomuraea dietziae]|uniref:hypothetical protein n=1 Tax=Nonomuraea dietziae TaxID=65515 RepID=UPI00342E35A1
MDRNSPHYRSEREAWGFVTFFSVLFLGQIVFIVLAAGGPAWGWSIPTRWWTGASVMALFIIARLLRWKRKARRLLGKEEDLQWAMRERMDEVRKAIDRSGQVLHDLRLYMDEQKHAADVLLERAERQRRLLEVDKDQAQVIRQILIEESVQNMRTGRRREWMFFALGMAASIPIGVLINLYVP